MVGMVRESMLFGLSLLTLFNPPSVMAAFASLARGFPGDVQSRMARRAAAYYAIVILLAVWAGRPLLTILGLTLPALRMAGGFVLLLAAVPMVTHYQRGSAEEDAELEAGTASRNWAQLVVVPVTFPMSIGGATVAAVIAATGEQPKLLRAAATSVVCLLMTAVVWLTIRSAVPLMRRFSRGSMAALTAVSGVLLLCVSFQLITAGLRDLLPGLRHH
jgi:multiple antibiotic resistance protein